jgi:hypothetical protein
VFWRDRVTWFLSSDELTVARMCFRRWQTGDTLPQSLFEAVLLRKRNEFFCLNINIFKGVEFDR